MCENVGKCAHVRVYGARIGIAKDARKNTRETRNMITLQLAHVMWSLRARTVGGGEREGGR